MNRVAHKKKQFQRAGQVASLVGKAKKHGIFVLSEGNAIDFIDEFTGQSLGHWKAKPWPQFTLKGIVHNGTPWQALAAIVAPYDL